MILSKRNSGKKAIQYICSTSRGKDNRCNRKAGSTNAGKLGLKGSMKLYVSLMQAKRVRTVACPRSAMITAPNIRSLLSAAREIPPRPLSSSWGGANYRGLTRMEVKNLVNNYHVNNIGGDPIQQTEALYSGTSSDVFLRKSELFHD